MVWYRERTKSLRGVPVDWVEAQQAGFFASNVVEINATISRVFIGPNSSTPQIDYMLLPFGSVWDTGMTLLEKAKILRSRQHRLLRPCINAVRLGSAS
jgi:hypothetical protein